MPRSLPPGVSHEDIVRAYVDEGLSLRNIRETLGVSQKTTLRHLRRDDIARRTDSRGRKRNTERDMAVIDLYTVRERSVRDVARLLGCSYGTVINVLDHYGIPKAPRGGYHEKASTT